MCVCMYLCVQVVGYRLTGVVNSYATSTDVVLTITKVHTCTMYMYMYVF